MPPASRRGGASQAAKPGPAAPSPKPAESSATITLTGGARLDHWRISGGHLFEKAIATGAVLRDEHDAARDGWLPTARGGVSARLGEGFGLRSAAYLGWRMPTLNELFRPFRAGLDATAANPGSQARAARRRRGRGRLCERAAVELSVTGFSNRLKQAIANVTLGHGPGMFPGVGFVAAGGAYSQRRNVDAVEGARDRSLGRNGRAGRGAWRAGASLTHARIEASGAAASLDGRRPAQTPQVRGEACRRAGNREGKGAALVLRRVGAQFDDDLNSDVLKGATTLDAYASWPLSTRLQLVARGENLTDTLVMAGIGGDGSVERATPRTLWLGLRLR